MLVPALLLAAYAVARASADIPLAGAACSLVEAGIPLGQAHSHNTYQQPGGLHDALASGFCSVEADFFYDGTGLFIAHDQQNISPDHTMQSDFLDPLLSTIQNNGGLVYPASRIFGACRTINLLADAKEYNGDVSEQAARKQFSALMTVLNQYQAKLPGLFTVFYKNGTIVPGKINVYVSGLRPSPDWVAAMAGRPLALDGRVLENLDNKYGPHVYPLVSQDFAEICPDPSPPDSVILEPIINEFQTKCMSDHADLIGGYIDQAHAQHRTIRFYSTADLPDMWGALISAGVDYVNVDALQLFRAYVFENWGSQSAV